MNLKKNKANFASLTPIDFIKRTANIFPNYLSLISENKKFTWGETYKRCNLFATSLIKKKIKHGDVVSIMAPNTCAMYEAHFAIPMIGAIINTINLRLDARTISYILNHSKTKLIFVDTEFLPIIRKALKIKNYKIPIVAIKDDKKFSRNLHKEQLYEDFLKKGSKNLFNNFRIKNEWSPISLGYTSGTTDKP